MVCTPCSQGFTATALIWTSLPLQATRPGELDRLEDALQPNFYAIEVIVFMRDPASVVSTEPLINQPPRTWPDAFMALVSQREQQRLLEQHSPWTKEINGQHCLQHAKAELPEFMRIVLSEGFEPELLNDFSAAGKLATLDPVRQQMSRIRFFLLTLPCLRQ